MATRRYLNFDLLLEQEGEGRYQARVTDSPLGETPSVRFQLPVRRDHAREPPPQARPGAVGHAQGRRYGPAAGRHGLRRSALPGGVHRRPRPGLAAQPGPGPGRAGRRAAPPPPAQRRAGDRRAAVGAAVRRPVQQLPGAVGAHAAGAVPRRAAGAATDRGRRAAARAGDHLLADRPRRARRRGRVGPDPGGPRATDLDRPGRARPAAERDALGARRPGSGVRRRTSCTSSVTATSTRACARASSTSRTRPGGAARSPRRRWARTCATTTPCGWWSSTPAGRRAPTPRTRSAGWPRASSSRTPRRSSPCSSRSATAPR